MKKIFKIIVLIILLSTAKMGVKAERFYEDNYLDNIFVTYKSDSIYKPQHMRYIRRKSDNIPVYCLTPSKLLYYDVDYSINNNYSYVTNEKLKRVSEIAYFGYGYKNHTEDKWYAITQVMIWKEMDNNQIYFNDTYKGNKIEKFTDEEKEINYLISNYHKELKINDLDLKYNDKTSVINDLLNNYDFSSDLNIKRNNNSLEITADKKGIYKVNLIHQDGVYKNNTLVYTSNKGQDIIVRGSIERPISSFNVNVTSGELNIQKIDSETENSDKRGKATVEDAKYGIYDINDNLIDTITIDNNGYGKTSLKYGDYYLKEINNSVGYNIDQEKYLFTINSDSKDIKVKENIIKSKINIHKKLENGLNEENIKFEIFDSNNNLVDTLITDSHGYASTNLIYDDYIIKQINTTKYYDKVDDIKIEVRKNEDINLDLMNKLIDSKLTIKKIDNDTRELIEDPVTFKIKDLINNKYIGDYTTLNGVVTTDIKAGKYKIYEINEPYGYIKCEPIEIEILDSNEFIIDIPNKKIELPKIETRPIIKKEENIEKPELKIDIPLEKTIKNNISKSDEIIKTDYPKTSNIDDCFIITIVYIVFILICYLYARIKEK